MTLQEIIKKWREEAEYLRRVIDKPDPYDDPGKNWVLLREAETLEACIKDLEALSER